MPGPARADWAGLVSRTGTRTGPSWTLKNPTRAQCPIVWAGQQASLRHHYRTQACRTEDSFCSGTFGTWVVSTSCRTNVQSKHSITLPWKTASIRVLLGSHVRVDISFDLDQTVNQDKRSSRPYPKKTLAHLWKCNQNLPEIITVLGWKFCAVTISPFIRSQKFSNRMYVAVAPNKYSVEKNGNSSKY